MARIQFANVDLEYPIRENQSVTQKEFIVRGLFRKAHTARRTVKALSNLTFTIDDGERVGIIGLNGAGKSTLLRTIGGIYPVQRGDRRVDGSICSLFEINVGFEINATGWQNIYFRSYFQGETPTSIKGKLHEIADFTELGDFLNLPLRCYSSGMVTRLAFAIATARHPEILLIDEVFGTGDVVFQKKAEQRMRDFMHRAQIVVMVGHNLDFLEEFCTRVIWLHQGSIRAIGPGREIIRAYLGEAAQLQKAA
jgi:ABC-type polysaccharide/polyol phosphate transport system ATPase subunit